MAADLITWRARLSNSRKEPRTKTGTLLGCHQAEAMKPP
jgi:hypothetical protein